LLAVLLVEVDDHLGVRLSIKSVAGFKAFPELFEIIDLAVEDHRNSLVLV